MKVIVRKLSLLYILFAVLYFRQQVWAEESGSAGKEGTTSVSAYVVMETQEDAGNKENRKNNKQAGNTGDTAVIAGWVILMAVSGINIWIHKKEKKEITYEEDL